MEVYKTILEIDNCLKSWRKAGRKIGFVPTMGALHAGHISLIEKAKTESDTVVCSIFVNPIQFNQQDDFDKYPRTLSEDCKLLNEVKCDIVFIPSINEIYPSQATEKFNFGALEKVMEGKFRPGHFNGVAIVVKKFFEIIRPDIAFFGEKDYQQLLIIRKLVDFLGFDIQITGCPISREKDGLAMSSRNTRLSVSERQAAANIPQLMVKSKDLAGTTEPDELKLIISNDFRNTSGLELEYFEIADGNNLESIKFWRDSSVPMGFVAVKAGDIRLIDNIRYF